MASDKKIDLDFLLKDGEFTIDIVCIDFYPEGHKTVTIGISHEGSFDQDIYEDHYVFPKIWVFDDLIDRAFKRVPGNEDIEDRLFEELQQEYDHFLYRYVSRKNKYHRDGFSPAKITLI